MKGDVMDVKGLRRLVALVAVVVALVLGVSAGADVGGGSGPPTAIGTGARPHSRELATQAAIDVLRAAATPSTQRSPQRACSESRSPSRAGLAAAASWSCGRLAVRSRRSTAARWRRRRCTRCPSGRTGPLAVQRGALQRSLGRGSWDRRDVGGGAREVRDDVPGTGFRPGDPRRASWLCDRPGLVRRDRRPTATGSTTSQRRASLYLDARRDAARRGHASSRTRL